jgi:high affinity Mn2+ porin
MILGIVRNEWRLFGRSLALLIGNSVKFLIFAVLVAAPCLAQDVAPDASVERIQKWNIHGQVTETPQGDPPFPALYSGPNSLDSHGEIQETFTSDLYAGARLWHGGEIHVDGLLWEGFGLSNDKGIEAFPNGDAFKLGTKTPYFMFAHLFIRQTIGFGGKQEPVPDGPLTLAGEQDISRLTFTLGRFTPTDMFDNNAYAQDPHTQFMNWAMITNLAWDFPADAVGYTTGLAVELNQPKWALRYGFFQMPSVQNSFTADDQILTFPHGGGDGEFLHSWGMVTEFERRYGEAHPGTIRALVFLNSADMISFRQAIPLLQANGPSADLSSAQAYRYKSGFGLNWQQKITDDVGVFSRFSWNDGQTEGGVYNDSNWAVSLGTSVKGAAWGRTNDALGLGYVRSGLSRSAQEFLALGGTDILDGDGALTYGSENVVEAYYNLAVWKEVHVTPDYQFVVNPASNRDRGPVSVFGIRLHWRY